MGLGAIGGMAALPAAAGAEVTAAYVGCSSSGNAPPSHECTLGETIAAFFESDEAVEYEICVILPNDDLACLPEQEAEADVLYYNELNTDQVGFHLFGWFLPGEDEPVAEWLLYVKQPSVPPAPPPPVLPIPPPVIIEPTTTVACVKARQKVKRARARLQAAEGRQRKATLRAKLKRARAAAKRAC